MLTLLQSIPPMVYTATVGHAHCRALHSEWWRQMFAPCRRRSGSVIRVVAKAALGTVTGVLVGLAIALPVPEIGRLPAKHVARVLAGTRPSDLPVENTRTPEFLINLRTTHELGITSPPEVVQRADDAIR